MADDESGDAAGDLYIEGKEVVRGDYGGLVLEHLTVVSSSFEDCRFERMTIGRAGFGAGMSMSRYVGCSFDGSTIRAGAPGRARFEHCSFRDVRLRDWFCFAVEFVDCEFTGRADKMIFNGAVPEDARGQLGRATNEFTGNDFSGMQLRDVAFRTGIDLSKQTLPTGGEYLFLPDARKAIAGVMAEASDWHDEDRRSSVLAVCHALLEDVDGGQAQLLLRPADFGSILSAQTLRDVFEPFAS